MPQYRTHALNRDRIAAGIGNSRAADGQGITMSGLRRFFCRLANVIRPNREDAAFHRSMS